MNHDLRTLTWKVTAADKSLAKILQLGDRLIFHGEGDTCRVTCIDEKYVRRDVWENAYFCEAAKPYVDKESAGIMVLGISGVMLSQEHGPYVLDATLVEAQDFRRLFCEVTAVHEAHKESLGSRIACQIGNDAGGLTTLSLDGGGPFGHASGQWHAQD